MKKCDVCHGYMVFHHEPLLTIYCDVYVPICKWWKGLRPGYVEECFKGE